MSLAFMPLRLLTSDVGVQRETLEWRRLYTHTPHIRKQLELRKCYARSDVYTLEVTEGNAEGKRYAYER